MHVVKRLPRPDHARVGVLHELGSPLRVLPGLAHHVDVVGDELVVAAVGADAATSHADLRFKIQNG